jgi:hypothetical protein
LKLFDFPICWLWTKVKLENRRAHGIKYLCYFYYYLHVKWMGKYQNQKMNKT